MPQAEVRGCAKATHLCIRARSGVSSNFPGIKYVCGAGQELGRAAHLLQEVAAAGTAIALFKKVQLPLLDHIEDVANADFSCSRTQRTLLYASPHSHFAVMMNWLLRRKGARCWAAASQLNMHVVRLNGPDVWVSHTCCVGSPLGADTAVQQRTKIGRLHDVCCSCKAHHPLAPDHCSFSRAWQDQQTKTVLHLACTW